MGFFNRIKNNWRKAEAAGIIRAMLEHHQKNGVFHLDPANVASVLVDKLWEGAPNTFDGRGVSPHKATAAAAAMMAVVYNAAKSGKLETNVLALSMCVFQILQEIEKRPDNFNFNTRDERVLSEVQRQFEEVQQDLELASLSV